MNQATKYPHKVVSAGLRASFNPAEVAIKFRLEIVGVHNCVLLFLAHTHIASLTNYTARWQILLDTQTDVHKCPTIAGYTN